MDFSQITNLYLPSAMAIFLAYIALQQMLINKNKLKLDLYNKRFEIYTDTLTFYQELIGEEVSKGTHRKFISSKEASFFLFSSDKTIYALLDQMHTESFKVIGFKKHGKELSGSPNHLIESNYNSLKVQAWFTDRVPELREKMSKYLNQ